MSGIERGKPQTPRFRLTANQPVNHAHPVESVEPHLALPSIAVIFSCGSEPKQYKAVGGADSKPAVIRLFGIYTPHYGTQLTRGSATSTHMAY
jgi:hypothetical protein